MSNRRKGETPEESGFDEPAPIQFGAGDDALSDEPGPIRFGGGPAPPPKLTPTPGASGDAFDFENGPSIVLPSYITRAAQGWDPDSPTRAKATPPPEPEPPPPAAPPAPDFKAPASPPPEPPKIEAPPPPPAESAPPTALTSPQPDEEAAQIYQPPPRRRSVPRPEPTYGVIRREPEPPQAAEQPKRYFTPLPEPGQTPPPPPPPSEPEPVVVEPQKPLIQIQINRMPPLFKGSGLMRGLFFGCLMGVAVGGIAAVLLDLLSPHPAPPPPPALKALNAQVLNAPVEARAPEAKARTTRKGVKGYQRAEPNAVVEPPPSIRVQSAPPPRAVLRPGGGPPLSADPNAGR